MFYGVSSKKIKDLVYAFRWAMHLFPFFEHRSFLVKHHFVGHIFFSHQVNEQCSFDCLLIFFMIKKMIQFPKAINIWPKSSQSLYRVLRGFFRLCRNSVHVANGIVKDELLIIQRQRRRRWHQHLRITRITLFNLFPNPVRKPTKKSAKIWIKIFCRKNRLIERSFPAAECCC